MNDRKWQSAAGDGQRPILITAFKPFGGRAVNASQQMVEFLPERIAGHPVEKITIPVAFGKSAEIVLEHCHKIRPAFLFMFGEAPSRSRISVEKQAKNIKIEDNERGKISENSNDVLFTSVPVKQIIEQMDGYMIEASHDAGTYVCNETFYTTLKALEHADTVVEFIHVPYLAIDGEEGADPDRAVAAALRFMELAVEIATATRR